MAWLYFLLLIITDLIGILLASFTLPGLWLMLAGAAVYAWLTHGYYVGIYTLITLLFCATAAEILEIFLGGAGAKKAGASFWGIIGGLIGAIVGGICLTGLIPIPILGTIIGICLGSFLGAFIVELVMGQPIIQSVQIGFGAAKGRFTGIVCKVLFGCLMFVVTLFAGFPLHSRLPANAAAVTAAPSTSP